MKKIFILLICLLSLIPIKSSQAAPHVLKLGEVLKDAAKNSPQLKASFAREEQAKAGVGIEMSNLLPHVDFDAIESTGFPGSSGLLGTGGLVGSPYRSGAAGGIVVKDNLWDFGRTQNAIKLSKLSEKLKKEDTQFAYLDIFNEALKTYYECARYRSEISSWNTIIHETKFVSDQVEKFVSTGQRSIVERYLSKALYEDAMTGKAEADEKLRSVINQLSIMTGLDTGDINCPTLEAHNLEIDNSITENLREASISESPLIARSKLELNYAEAQIKKARSEYYPKLIAVGSAGVMEKSRLVPEKDYSLGVGFIMPLFDGLKTQNEVRRSKLSKVEKEHNVEAAQQQLSLVNAQYDKLINSSRIKLQHLEQELNLAHKTLDTARSRYFSFQGTLVDLQESLRYLSRTLMQIYEAKATYLEATGAKKIINVHS